MKDLLKILFCLNFSLILLHEMDAIRCKEWKMFIYLKDMKEGTAYKVFTLLHLPLYFALIFFMLDNTTKLYPKIAIGIDVFLIFHSIIHFLFRNNKNNEINSLFSKCLIYAMGLISIIHIILFSLF